MTHSVNIASGIDARILGREPHVFEHSEGKEVS